MNRLKFLTLTIILVMAAIFTAPRLMTVEASAPTNDDFYSATVVSTLPFSDVVDVKDATLGPYDYVYENCLYTPNKSVWYSFTPATTTSVTISAVGSTYDVGLEIFTGADYQNRVLNYCMPNLTYFNYELTGGTTYYFMLFAPNVPYPGGEDLEWILHFSLSSEPYPGTWSPTGSMTVARITHTATLMNDGRVLAAGGFNNSGVTANTELYDPATGNWNPTSAMSSSRRNHIAAALLDGRVLVTGGLDNNYSKLNSTEIYDPAIGIWNSTGSLNTARVGHSGVVLADGRVLVAGGDNNGYLSSVEVYNPATGTWSYTGSMNTPRQQFLMTRLTDGRVLVAGGWNNAQLVSSELYDPNTGTWIITGDMVTAGFSSEATLLLDGRVFVAGSSNTGSEIYDPATGIWSLSTPMITTRTGFTTTRLPDGQVLASGGAGSNGTIYGAETFDLAKGAWTPTGPMNEIRQTHTATLLPDGRVLVAGGYNGSYLASAEIYTPPPAEEPLVWQYKASMPTARYNMGVATTSDGKIYVVGGDNWSCTPLTNLEAYDPTTNTWSVLAPMPTGRWGLKSTAFDGKVYAFGGLDGCDQHILATVEVYNPTDDTWETRSPMPTPRTNMGVAAANGKIYVMGGIDVIDTSVTAIVEEYDPFTDTWTRKADMPYVNHSFGIATADDGKIYIFGGAMMMDAAFAYDPTSDSWAEVAKMPTPRDTLGAAKGSNGNIYAVGGFSGSWIGPVEEYNPQTDTWSVQTALPFFSGGLAVAASHNSIYAIGGFGYYPDGSPQGALDSVLAASLVPEPVLDPPIADFTWSPADPSIYDLIQFCDSSTDPAAIGFNNFWWDFGDGATLETSAACVTHTYAADGDYNVAHTVQTSDGRSAQIAKTVGVRTHDVTISRFVVPPNARVGQTKQISIGVRNLRYAETVTVELYKSTPTGYVLVNQQTKIVPVRSDNRMTDFIFNYKFTTADIGKMTFRTVAIIQGYRDARPADNTAISMPTVVSR